MTPLVVPPEEWVDIPGSDPPMQVWHRQHRTVVITDHAKGVHGLGLRLKPKATSDA